MCVFLVIAVATCMSSVCKFVSASAHHLCAIVHTAFGDMRAVVFEPAPFAASPGVPGSQPLDQHLVSRHINCATFQPKLNLQPKFTSPQVAHKLAQLPETWWYQEPRKPNCAASKTINSLESRAHQKQRVGEFARWLSKRPEKFVILIGHCSFWKEFSRTSDPMKNGEMRRMRW